MRPLTPFVGAINPGNPKSPTSWPTICCRIQLLHLFIHLFMPFTFLFSLSGIYIQLWNAINLHRKHLHNRHVRWRHKMLIDKSRHWVQINLTSRYKIQISINSRIFALVPYLFCVTIWLMPLIIKMKAMTALLKGQWEFPI